MKNQDPESLSSNLEDYLEAISHLQRENKVARAKDIADWLHVSRASVTGALKTLGERGLINYSPYSFVTLTDQGAVIADEIIRRHTTLKDFFANFLLLDPKRADDIACRVEHAVDSETMDRLVSFLNFMRHCPRSGEDWLESFNLYCHKGVGRADCQACVTACLAKVKTKPKA